MRAGSPLTAVLAALFVASSAGAQLRIAFYNIAGIQGSSSAMGAVIEEIHADETRGFATPADILVFTEVRQSNIAALNAIVANAAPPGVSYALGTFTTSGSEDSASGANAIYLRIGRVSEIPAGHKDIFTGASRNADRWLVNLVGYTSPQAQMYVYAAHLKASPGGSNEDARLAGVQAMRADADALPAGTHIVYSGDMNFYAAAESGYQWWIGQPGNGIAFDMIPGEWTGAANAIKHTQSPRDISGGLTGGGMDDRFDLMLLTGAVVDNDGLSVIPGTTRALGNDGLHYDKAINNGNNFYFPGQLVRSNALADALFDASDHVPVIMDLQQPAVFEAWVASQPGRVIRLASVSVETRIWNALVPVDPMGVDPLAYMLVGSGAVTGSTSGMAPLEPETASAFLSLNTSVVGPLSGSITASSPNQAVQNPVLVLPVVGSVVRKANASFSGSSDLNSTTAQFSVTSGAGVVELSVPIFNLGFDSNQALLDVDLTTLNAGAAPFTVIDGSSLGIGASPDAVRFGFDTTGLAPGRYTRGATITCTDENIPGEDVSFLTLTLAVTVGSGLTGDLNGDGVVNGSDLAILLGQWGSRGIADLNGNGIVDGADIAILLGNWS